MRLMIGTKLLLLLVNGCLAAACFGQNASGPADIELPNPQRWPSVACTPEELARVRQAYRGAGSEHNVVARQVEWADEALKRAALFPPEGGQHNQWYQCGFIRVATNPKLGAARVPLADARRVVEGWLDLPQVRTLTPGALHFTRVMDLMTAAMAAGPVLSDAILAAYAIKHRAKLFTNDGDFARFPGLDWKNLLLPA